MEVATEASPSSLIAVTISVFITTEESVSRIPSPNKSAIAEGPFSVVSDGKAHTAEESLV